MAHKKRRAGRHEAGMGRWQVGVGRTESPVPNPYGQEVEAGRHRRENGARAAYSTCQAIA